MYIIYVSLYIYIYMKFIKLCIFGIYWITYMQCTFLSSEVAVVFLLQIQSNEWSKHSYIFWFECVSFVIYPNEIDTGIWSGVQEPSMTVDNNICQSHFRREVMIISMLVRLHNGLEWAGTWAFVRCQAYGLLFLTLHSNRSEDSKPWRDQQVAVFLPGNCVYFWCFPGLLQTWRWCKLVTVQCVIEAVREVTLGATLLLHTGLVCWWSTQSSVRNDWNSWDNLKPFCKMLVDWCHPCCFCQHFEVQLVTTRADKLSMQPIRIFCSDGTNLAVKG